MLAIVAGARLGQPSLGLGVATKERAWWIRVPMRPRTLLVLAALTYPLLFGCDTAKSLIGDNPPLTGSSLTIAVTSSAATGRFVLLNGVSVYQCDFPLLLSFTGGKAGDRLSWEGGTFTARRNSDGQQSAQQLIFSDYTTIFGAGSFDVGHAPVTGTLSFRWTGPYTATLVTNYGTSGTSSLSTDKSTSTSLTCN